VINHLCYFGDIGLLHIVRNSDRLRSLSIRGCHRITGSAFASIVHESLLSTLDASRCMGLKRISFTLINKRLQELYMEGCYFLKPQLSHCSTTNLTKISLSSCSLINEAFLIELLTKSPLLTHLDLSSCYRISGETLSSLKNMCRNLQYLSMEGNTNVTDKDVEDYLGSNPLYLTEVDLCHCQLITYKVLKHESQINIRII